MPMSLSSATLEDCAKEQHYDRGQQHANLGSGGSAGHVQNQVSRKGSFGPLGWREALVSRLDLGDARREKDDFHSVINLQ
jgi:hypothetical protein